MPVWVNAYSVKHPEERLHFITHTFITAEINPVLGPTSPDTQKRLKRNHKNNSNNGDNPKASRTASQGKRESSRCHGNRSPNPQMRRDRSDRFGAERRRRKDWLLTRPVDRPRANGLLASITEANGWRGWRSQPSQLLPPSSRTGELFRENRAASPLHPFGGANKSGTEA